MGADWQAWQAQEEWQSRPEVSRAPAGACCFADPFYAELHAFPEPSTKWGFTRLELGSPLAFAMACCDQTQGEN